MQWAALFAFCTSNPLKYNVFFPRRQLLAPRDLQVFLSNFVVCLFHGPLCGGKPNDQRRTMA